MANTVMGVMIAWVEWNGERGKKLLNKSLIKETYDRSTEESKLRKFLVWYAVFSGVGITVDLEWLERTVRDDSRFAADVAIYSTRLYDKDASVKRIAITALRECLYIVPIPFSVPG